MKIVPIGIIQTCFSEKFGVPRQSLMVNEARGVIKLHPEFSHPDTVSHLEDFTHLWVIYEFHKIQNSNHEAQWTPTIQPPRIDAPKRVGVFASRSPHRPNPVGLSVVKLEKINIKGAHGVEIEVSGVDILDGSPVIDIKPYVPYADIVSAASSGWIKNEIARYPVQFSSEAMKVIELARRNELAPNLKKLITEILEWDPRPRSQREHTPIESNESLGKRFAFRLFDFDIHWEIVRNANQLPGIQVVEVKVL